MRTINASSLPRDYREQLELTKMRKAILWRLTPTSVEESFIREQAAKEGRRLSDMTHKLLSEAILARQTTQTQTRRLVAAIRGEASDFPATSS
jgi:hypothetical protein